MPSEGTVIKLKRTTAALSNNDLANYTIVYGEPLYFDNTSGQFLAIGDHDSATAANAYLVKLVPRQVTQNGTTVNVAANPVFYKILSQNDNTAVAIIKDDGTEVYPLTTLNQVIDTTTGSSVSLDTLLAKKVDVDIVSGTTITNKIGMGVDSGGIYVTYT